MNSQECPNCGEDHPDCTKQPLCELCQYDESIQGAEIPECFSDRYRHICEACERTLKRRMVRREEEL